MNETNRSASHWKRKAAMAIGRPDLATEPDDVLEKAHDAHMNAMMQIMDEVEDKDMPPGPASVANSFSLANEAASKSPMPTQFRDKRQKEAYREGLIAETMQRQNVTRDRAIRYIETMYPSLARDEKPPVRSARQIEAANERTSEILHLVNEKQKDYSEFRSEEAYEKAFAFVRSTRPDLFPGKRPTI
jgi:hypothetical protein